MKYTLFCRKLGKMSRNLLSAAVEIDALRVKTHVRMLLAMTTVKVG